MKKEFYHTAMKINIDTFDDVMPEEYFEKKKISHKWCENC